MTDKFHHTLENLIGWECPAYIPIIRSEDLISITIRGVESSGLWVTNQGLGIGVSRNPGEPHEELEDLPPSVVFVPFAQIGFIICGDTPTLRKSQLLHFSPKQTPAPE